MQGYDFTLEKALALVELGYVPEMPRPEAAVVLDFIKARGHEYDRFSFSVRVGLGQTANPDFEPGIQRAQEFTTKKRIDLIAWQGANATIVEAKLRISADLMGKLFIYRQLFMEENPDAQEPRLVGIGRFVDPDIERVLGSHGIDLYVYD